MRAYLIARGAAPARDMRQWVSSALASGADAIVPDAVEPSPWIERGERFEDARASGRAPLLWPRIAGLDHPDSEAALAALMAATPDAIVLAVTHGRDVTHLGARLAVHEAEAGRADGATGIVAVLDGARGILNAPSLVGASPRLRAIGWEAEPLAAELGTPGATDATGWIGPLVQARASVRLAAAAAGVAAIESDLAPGDPEGLRRVIAAARRDGFSGMFAHAPEQVAPIRGG